MRCIDSKNPDWFNMRKLCNSQKELISCWYDAEQVEVISKYNKGQLVKKEEQLEEAKTSE